MLMFNSGTYGRDADRHGPEGREEEEEGVERRRRQGDRLSLLLSPIILTDNTFVSSTSYYRQGKS